jgi:hypothetical protein
VRSSQTLLEVLDLCLFPLLIQPVKKKFVDFLARKNVTSYIVEIVIGLPRMFAPERHFMLPEIAVHFLVSHHHRRLKTLVDKAQYR